MQIIENLKVKEKMYIEKLENGLTVIIVPKNDLQKKYVIWGTNFGSIDNHFIDPKTNEEVTIPDGVAHFLEHKMFEQRTGINSLDTLSMLGVDANAYTTNDHTAYLFEATDNFYEAFDEFMDYVQNPYYTDENVEKEKGIIAQEIKMYDDDPGWQLYMNTMKNMYNVNPIRIDIAGTVESISGINKEMLYTCYNTFYNPSNMTLVICGDFKPEEMLEEVKKRLVPKDKQAEIKRLYEKEPEPINKKSSESTMDVSNPIFMIGYKDKFDSENSMAKKYIAIQIVLDMLMGTSSELYKKLYEAGLLFGRIDSDYEFSKEYAHCLISGQSKAPEKVIDMIKEEIEKAKAQGLNEDDFTRIKKKIYGSYVVEYNEPGNIARMILSDYFKGINSFDYLESYNLITFDYAKQILNDLFTDDKMVYSIIRGK